jgi:hypothetical protein
MYIYILPSKINIMNSICVILNAMQTSISGAGLKICLDKFVPRVRPILSQVGINVEITQKYRELVSGEVDDKLNNIVEVDEVQLIFNGYLYNRSKLILWSGQPEFSEKSDQEIIICLYIKYGIEYVAGIIDGRFSFVIIDQRNCLSESRLFIVQDKSGTIPMYILKSKIHIHNDESIFAISSEKQNLYKILNWLNGEHNYTKMLINKMDDTSDYDLVRIAPGSYMSFVLPMKVSACWKGDGNPTIFDTVNKLSIYPDNPDISWQDMLAGVQSCFFSIVINRIESSEGMISCFMDTTYESYFLADMISKYCKANDLPKIHTYSISFSGSKMRDIVDVSGINSIHKDIIIDSNDPLKTVNESYETLYSKRDHDPMELSRGQIASTIMDNFYNDIVGKQIVSDCNELYPSKKDKPKLVFLNTGASALMNGYFENTTISKNASSIEYDMAVRKYLAQTSEFVALSSYMFMECDNNIQCVFPYMDNGFVANILFIPPHLRVSIMNEGGIMRRINNAINDKIDVTIENVMEKFCGVMYGY